jgi:hypothetical protein
MKRRRQTPTLPIRQVIMHCILAKMDIEISTVNDVSVSARCGTIFLHCIRRSNVDVPQQAYFYVGPHVLLCLGKVDFYRPSVGAIRVNLGMFA